MSEPELTAPFAMQDTIHPAGIGHLASTCLKREVMTYPKPGLESHIDSGAHDDMDAALMYRSATCPTPYFIELAHAGASSFRGGD
jgi:triphosphoribosyl-dephospho-CoA synthase